MNERVIRLIALLGESKSTFAAKIGVSPAVMSHIASGRNKVGTEVLEGIIREFPQVSVVWLFTGNGHAFNNQVGPDLDAARNELKLLAAQIREVEALMSTMKRRLEMLSNTLK